MGKPGLFMAPLHFYDQGLDYLSIMGEDIGIVRILEIDYPGRTFAVIPVGGPIDLPPGVTPDIYPTIKSLNRALKPQVRPVTGAPPNACLRGFHCLVVPWQPVAKPAAALRLP